MLVKKLELFEQRIAEQNRLLGKQSKRIAELESRLNKNSGNSNKPPSSDGLAKAPALPRGKGKKRGGQPGHRGRTLEMAAVADHSEVLGLSGRCECGADLSGLPAEVGRLRQVFDIQTRLEVTEYVQMEGRCGCGRCHAGVFPPGVNSPVQYGNGVRALTTLLTQDYNVSVDKTRQLFADLFGYQINESTILSNTARCHDHLERSERAIKEAVVAAPVGHYDETGVRTAGKLHWLHVACCTLYSYFFVHANRGRAALDDAGMIGRTANWMVHDCWESYFHYTNGRHALCGAHLLRELRALTQKGNRWAGLFSTLLLDLHDLTDRGTGRLEKADRPSVERLYDDICQYADNLEPLAYREKNRRGKAKQSDGRNLLTRLVRHRSAVLAFAFHQEVPFTNNLAERALRPAKTKQKVAGTWRTLTGAQHYARIRSFVDTARKQQRNVFHELKAVFGGHSFIVHPADG